MQVLWWMASSFQQMSTIMNMNEIEFDKILHLNSKSGKRLRINDHIICEFVVPEDLEDWQTYIFFSEQWKEKNCPRFSCYADVTVNDIEKQTKVRGKLYHNRDMDLDGLRSFMLYMYDSPEAKTPFSGVTVSSCVIEDIAR